MALNAFSFAGLFAFISVGSFILQGVYGLSEKGFALVFGLGCLCFVSGSFMASRVMRRHGLTRSIAIGVAMLAGGGVAMLIAALASRSLVALIAPMLVYWGRRLRSARLDGERDGALPAPRGRGVVLSGAGADFVRSADGRYSWAFAVRRALPLPVCTALTGTAALTLFLMSAKARAAHRA